MRKIRKIAYLSAFVVLIWSMVGVTHSTPRIEMTQQGNATRAK